MNILKLTEAHRNN